MTAEEKKELEALKAKKAEELTDKEKARLTELEAKAADGDDAGKSYSEAYVKGLRTESAKYRTKLRELEEKMAKFDEIDPQKYHELMQAQKDAEQAKLAEQGEWEKLKEQLIKEHDKELINKQNVITEFKQTVAQLEKELERTILSHEITVAASMADAINPKYVEMDVISTAKVLKTEDGRRVIQVLDAEGNPRVNAKEGTPFTVAQLIEEMKQTPASAHLFKGGKAGAGSGTEHVFDGKGINNPWKRDTFNLTLQGEIVKSDPALAARLRKEAGV